MTCGELRRWLSRQGATFEERREHTKVMLKGRVSFLPRHQKEEIKPRTFYAILKQLGLK
ncbi:MAG: type II toxin-antitoxin system HicA family toxin [Acidobacteria bacterium]|nr:type II toxin-antitoxin system HicA family toxin [Acidobacteriota bacterium]